MFDPSVFLVMLQMQSGQVVKLICVPAGCTFEAGASYFLSLLLAFAGFGLHSIESQDTPARALSM